MIQTLCTPAFIYLIFGIAHIILSIFNSAYGMAMKQFLMTLLFTSLLNMLCERNMTIISWVLIVVPFVIMAVIVLLAKFKEMREDSKARKLNKINRNRDIVLYHDHGPDYDNYKHGIGIRDENELKHTTGESIEEKRNYKYEIPNTEYDGINQMRFIRDQRLSTY